MQHTHITTIEDEYDENIDQCMQYDNKNFGGLLRAGEGVYYSSGGEAASHIYLSVNGCVCAKRVTNKYPTASATLRATSMLVPIVACATSFASRVAEFAVRFTTDGISIFNLLKFA